MHNEYLEKYYKQLKACKNREDAYIVMDKLYTDGLKDGMQDKVDTMTYDEWKEIGAIKNYLY